MSKAKDIARAEAGNPFRNEARHKMLETTEKRAGVITHSLF